MYRLPYFSIVVTAAIVSYLFLLSTPIAYSRTGKPETDRNTADTVSLDPASSNYFKHFAPELQATLYRIPPIDETTGLYVEEIEPDLFFVTEGIYQSAFLVTREGVIVFDAPPSFAHKLPSVINELAPDTSIKYLIYSHGHTDHIGGAAAFKEVEGLKVIAATGVSERLRNENNPAILPPTLSFEETYTLKLGGEKVHLKATSFHDEDTDVIIHLPKQKFVMAVDTITPGEVPFMNFGATSDVGRYLTFFDEILAYDFDYILSGHVSILGTREDVLLAKEYTLDVQRAVLTGMQDFMGQFYTVFEKFEYQNPNLAYRYVIEDIRGECSAAVIEKWSDQLSVVDVWADSHCQTMILYYIMH